MEKEIDKTLDKGSWVGNYYCVADEFDNKESCCSSDALSVYVHKDDSGNIYYDGYCNSCNQFFSKHEIHESTLASELGIQGGKVLDPSKIKLKPKPQPLTKEEVFAFANKIGYKSNNCIVTGKQIGRAHV